MPKTREKPAKKSNTKWIIYIVLIVLVVFAIKITSSVVAIVNTTNQISARYLTDEHHKYAPINILESGDVYFTSSSIALQFNENLPNIGFLAHKDESFINDILLSVGTLHYDENDEDFTELVVVDDNTMTYTSSKYFDEQMITNLLAQFDEFDIIDTYKTEDYESFFVKNNIDKELLIELNENFGTVNYVADDYKKAENIFYIYTTSERYNTTQELETEISDEELLDIFNGEPMDSSYIASILVFENNYYYGSFENKIEGETLDALIKILPANNWKNHVNTKLAVHNLIVHSQFLCF